MAFKRESKETKADREELAAMVFRLEELTQTFATASEAAKKAAEKLEHHTREAAKAAERLEKAVSAQKNRGRW